MAINLKEKLDNLEWSVKNTWEELDDLAKKIAEWIDWDKVENYKKTYSNYKEILDNLKKDLDALSWAEKEEREKQIEKIEWDLQELKKSIDDIETVSWTGSSTSKNKRTFKEWISDQRHALWNWDEWEKNKDKNILRVAGAWWIILAIRSIFKRNDKEDNEWFRDRPLWRALKWIWIGIWTIFWIKTLMNKENYIKAPDSKKYTSYDSFAENPDNKELFNNYENLWEFIDVVYEKLYDRELKAWYQDDLKMNRISIKESDGEKEYKWIVPYCIDKHFRSVDDFLWQNSSMKEALAAHFDGMLEYLTSRWNDFLELFANMYLEKLPSWLPFKNAAWSLIDRINEWRLNSAQSEEEMAYFFRQSIRIQTYLFEKRNQLEDKILDSAVNRYWIDKEKVEKDKDSLKEYVYNDKDYQLFINGKISDANKVLTKYSIFDNEIWGDVKKVTEDLDKERDKVIPKLDDKDDLLEVIAKKAEEKEWLSDQEDQLLIQACTNINTDIDNNILEIVEDSARNLWWDFLHNSGSWAALREYIEKASIKPAFEEYKKSIDNYKEKLQKGELSNEDKYLLASQINNMIALKKEAILWEHTIKVDWEKNGDITCRIPWLFGWAWKNIVKWFEKIWHWKIREGASYINASLLPVWATLVISGGILCIKDPVKWVKLMKIWARVGAAPEVATYKWIMFFVKSNRKSCRYIAKHWVAQYIGLKSWENLYKNLIDGTITLEDAWNIIARKTSKNFRLSTTKKSIMDEFKLGDKTSPIDAQRQLLKKLIAQYRSTDASSFVPQLENERLLDKFVKYYDKSKEVRWYIHSWNIDDLKDALRAAEYLDDAKPWIKFSSEWDSMVKEILQAENEIREARILKEKSFYDDITLFRKELSWIDNLETLRKQQELFRLIKKRWWNRWASAFTDAIGDLKVLKKILWESGSMDIDVNWVRKTIKYSEILDNMDDLEDILKVIKWLNKFDDTSIDNLIKVFGKLKEWREIKFVGKMEDAADAFKWFIKILSKTT